VPIGEEVKEKILCGNAAKILELEERSVTAKDSLERRASGEWNYVDDPLITKRF
jgi:hypothetical protein